MFEYPLEIEEGKSTFYYPSPRQREREMWSTKCLVHSVTLCKKQLAMYWGETEDR